MENNFFIIELLPLGSHLNGGGGSNSTLRHTANLFGLADSDGF